MTRKLKSLLLIYNVNKSHPNIFEHIRVNSEINMYVFLKTSVLKHGTCLNGGA